MFACFFTVLASFFYCVLYNKVRGPAVGAEADGSQLGVSRQTAGETARRPAGRFKPVPGQLKPVSAQPNRISSSYNRLKCSPVLGDPACFRASRIRIHLSKVRIWLLIWIRILSFSHKGVEWTEIMLAKILTQNLSKNKFLRLKIMYLRVSNKKKI
jgi:hypothetical protein